VPEIPPLSLPSDIEIPSPWGEALEIAKAKAKTYALKKAKELIVQGVKGAIKKSKETLKQAIKEKFNNEKAGEPCKKCQLEKTKIVVNPDVTWPPVTEEDLPEEGIAAQTPIGELKVMPSDYTGELTGNMVSYDEYQALKEEGLSPPSRWGSIDAIKYKIGDSPGPTSSLALYKDDWVKAHKTTIEVLSRRHDMPPQVLGGITWVEAGGSPPIEDWAAYTGRNTYENWFKDSRVSDWFPSSFKVPPERTTFGEVQINLENAANVLGLDAKNDIDIERLKQILDNPQMNLAIVSQHVDNLLTNEYGKIMIEDFKDEHIIYAGMAYNGSGDKAKDYGEFIADKERQNKILGLLKSK